MWHVDGWMIVIVYRLLGPGVSLVCYLLTASCFMQLRRDHDQLPGMSY